MLLSTFHPPKPETSSLLSRFKFSPSVCLAAAVCFCFCFQLFSQLRPFGLSLAETEAWGCGRKGRKEGEAITMDGGIEEGQQQKQLQLRAH